MGPGRGWRGVLAATVVIAATACTGDDGGEAAEPPLEPDMITTAAPRIEPMSPEELGVVLDPAGRPYDAVHFGDATTETRFLEVFHFADGEVRVMDGNAVQVDPSSFDAVPVDFDDEDLRVSIVWERSTVAGTEYEAVLGVRLDVDGSSVSRWGPLEFAYGTDGGVGGVTSQAVRDRAAGAAGGGDDSFLDDVDFSATHQVFDVDGEPGPDTLVFVNGSGDGAFPMARGFDGAENLVSLLIWDARYPWRLAVSDGIPPPDITEREDQLRECLDGNRPIDEYGQCTDDT